MQNDLFFNDSVFIKTSNVSSDAKRLNERCKLLLNNVDLKNKRVLDIGCHNGRWIYAALKLGAKFVYGIDICELYLNVANKNLKIYQEFDKKYKLKRVEMMEFLKSNKQKFDIIFCFGVMYHTLDQYEILKECKRMKPDLLIIDTNVFDFKLNENVISLNTKGYELKKDSYTLLFVDKTKNNGWEVIPSEKMFDVWLENIGFSYKKLINFDNSISELDYFKRQRVTYHCYLKNKFKFHL